MARLTTNKKLVSVVACGLIASAFAPAAAPAYYATGSGSDSNSGSESNAANAPSGPTPDVVLSRSDNPSASSAVTTSGPTPDVLLSRSENAPATSNALTSGSTPDVLLSRTDNPLSTPQVASVSDDSGGLDWGSAGIGAAIAVGLIVLSLAGLLGVREVRRNPARP